MAWEKRGNRTYFYKKERIGGKIKSVYYGSGVDALLIADIEYLEREIQESKSERRRRERAEIEKLDEQINEISKINQSLVDALFLINGFHLHKGQWRKRRK